MAKYKPLHLFEGFGIELEYMIVDKDSLNVLPITDKVIYEVSGTYESEIELGKLNWSNELVLHVIELKTNGPAKSLNNLTNEFNNSVKNINEILKKFNGKLMPTAMHPWMKPLEETKLWPHENSPVYETYNRIFGCQGHGWSNLQSVHINLPFKGDKEFAKLHAAIRLILTILPAIAAASPIVENKLTGILDSRLDAYRKNQIKVPIITGRVIPEKAFTKKDYEKKILQKIYKEISPLDPDKIIQYEWLNSRGAIARFDRDTIEIRVLDIQECPAADIAISALIVSTLKALTDELWSTVDFQKKFNEVELEKIFLGTMMEAENYIITDREFLKAFNLDKEQISAGELWKNILEDLIEENRIEKYCLKQLDTILNQGTLSTRILRSLNNNYSAENIKFIYGKLCDCLANGEMFVE